jgi:hypothetical protein
MSTGSGGVAGWWVLPILAGPGIIAGNGAQSGPHSSTWATETSMFDESDFLKMA